MKRLANEFYKEYRCELSDVVMHNDSIGGVWRVKLEKMENALWLHDGWEKFVKDHSITYGYFLLFKYKGNSSFKVQVFDMSTTEVDFSNSIGKFEVINLVDDGGGGGGGGDDGGSFEVLAPVTPNECGVQAKHARKYDHETMHNLVLSSAESAYEVNKHRCDAGTSSSSQQRYSTQSKCKRGDGAQEIEMGKPKTSSHLQSRENSAQNLVNENVQGEVQCTKPNQKSTSNGKSSSSQQRFPTQCKRKIEDQAQQIKLGRLKTSSSGRYKIQFHENSPKNFLNVKEDIQCTVPNQKLTSNGKSSSSQKCYPAQSKWENGGQEVQMGKKTASSHGLYRLKSHESSPVDLTSKNVKAEIKCIKVNQKLTLNGKSSSSQQCSPTLSICQKGNGKEEIEVGEQKTSSHGMSRCQSHKSSLKNIINNHEKFQCIKPNQESPLNSKSSSSQGCYPTQCPYKTEDGALVIKIGKQITSSHGMSRLKCQSTSMNLINKNVQEEIQCTRVNQKLTLNGKSSSCQQCCPRRSIHKTEDGAKQIKLVEQKTRSHGLSRLQSHRSSPKNIIKSGGEIQCGESSTFQQSYPTRSLSKIGYGAQEIKMGKKTTSSYGMSGIQSKGSSPKNLINKNVPKEIQCTKANQKSTLIDEKGSFSAVKRSQEKKAAPAAVKLLPRMPSFKLIMQRYNLHPVFMLHIPTAFAVEHLLSSPGPIELHDCEGKKWLVHAKIENDKVHLVEGWETLCGKKDSWREIRASLS